MHKEYFAQRVKFARLSVLHGGSILHGENFAQNNTNLKQLSKNFKERLFTIKKYNIKNRLVYFF